MKKILLGIGILLALFLVVGVVRGEAILLGIRAGQTPKTTLVDLQQKLEPSIHIALPDQGTGPFPVVLQFHGCAGARLDFQKMYAQIANEAGYASVIVDSMRPRGLSRTQALEKVCTGEMLIGQERAGDILAAIGLAEKHTDLDATRLVLTGWSHGAWSVMDFLTMDMHTSKPASLGTVEGSRPEIEAAVLFYPYCGIGTLSRIAPWQQAPDVLAFLAQADTIVDHKQCLRRFERLRAKGISIAQTLYPGTEHAFDDPFIEAEWKDWHHPDHMRDAIDRYRAFLIDLRRKR